MALKDKLIGAYNGLVPTTWQVGFREAAGVTVDADEANWRKLTEDTGRDLTPVTQRRMQKMAHFLWEQNLLGNRLVELPLAYLLAEGVSLKVEDEENQLKLDEFWTDPINDMDLKLPKKVRELALFGEQIYPVFVNEANGAVRLGYIDPQLLETVVVDPDNPEQPIGLVLCKDKRGRALRYRVIVNGPEQIFSRRTREIRAGFTDGEAFYFRVNDLSSGRRGRSDLLAQADWLDAYDAFLFGEIERQNFLRAFLWDVTLKGANAKEVEERATKIFAPKPGSVRVHNDAETWSAEAPNLQAADTSTAARLLRNHILGGASMPEHWFGGGGDVNRAVGAEMAEPTMKIYSMRQRMLKHMLESIGRYVLMKRAASEAAIKWGEPAWRVQAVFPELAVKDTSKYATALAQVAAAAATAISSRLMSRKFAIQLIVAVAGRLGVEADAEELLTEAEAEANRDAEGDVFTQPGSDEPGPGAE